MSERRGYVRSSGIGTGGAVRCRGNSCLLPTAYCLMEDVTLRNAVCYPRPYPPACACTHADRCGRLALNRLRAQGKAGGSRQEAGVSESEQAVPSAAAATPASCLPPPALWRMLRCATRFVTRDRTRLPVRV